MGNSKLIFRPPYSSSHLQILGFFVSADPYISKTTTICPGGVYELCELNSLQVSIPWLCAM